MIDGFDYRLGESVRLTRAQCRERLAQAASTVRVGGDLLVKDRAGSIVLELYAWRSSAREIAMIGAARGGEKN